MTLEEKIKKEVIADCSCCNTTNARFVYVASHNPKNPDVKKFMDEKNYIPEDVYLYDCTNCRTTRFYAGLKKEIKEKEYDKFRGEGI